METGTKRKEHFAFPIGLDATAACTALIPEIEILFEQLEKERADKQVKDDGASRSDIAGSGVLTTDDELFLFVLDTAFNVSSGVEAQKYDSFLHEFTDAEIDTLTPLSAAQAATWKTNSAANLANFVQVKDYTPLA